MASGVFLVVFWIYFHAGKRVNGSKSTGISGIIFVREKVQKARPFPHVHTC
jgi:hypothetical protein